MLTTTQINSYGATQYEFNHSKIPSEVVQKEETKQQPEIDNNISGKLSDNQSEKKVSDENSDYLNEKLLDFKKQEQTIQDNYTTDLSQKRNQSHRMLGIALDILV